MFEQTPNGHVTGRRCQLCVAKKRIAVSRAWRKVKGWGTSAFPVKPLEAMPVGPKTSPQCRNMVLLSPDVSELRVLVDMTFLNKNRRFGVEESFRGYTFGACRGSTYGAFTGYMREAVRGYTCFWLEARPGRKLQWCPCALGSWAAARSPWLTWHTCHPPSSRCPPHSPSAQNQVGTTARHRKTPPSVDSCINKRVSFTWYQKPQNCLKCDRWTLLVLLLVCCCCKTLV